MRLRSGRQVAATAAAAAIASASEAANSAIRAVQRKRNRKRRRNRKTATWNQNIAALDAEVLARGENFSTAEPKVWNLDINSLRFHNSIAGSLAHYVGDCEVPDILPIYEQLQPTGCVTAAVYHNHPTLCYTVQNIKGHILLMAERGNYLVLAKGLENARRIATSFCAYMNPY